MPSIIPKITINGKESTEISGLMIVSLPPIIKPAMRAVAEEIDGRDGDQIEKLGFSAYDKTIRIALSGNYDVDDVIEYFNQDGIITFSNEPDKYYRFKQLEGIDFEKLMRYKTADVVFHCQPFKFSTTEEELTFFEPHSVSITNAGNIYSKPEIALTGHGNIEMGINGSPVLAVDFGDEQQTIIIDSEKMNAYGAKSNIKSLITEINPKQDLHGYDHPWIDVNAGDNIPYIKRNVAGTASRIGNALIDKLIGGSYAWNQLIQNGNFSNNLTNWDVGGNTNANVSNNICYLTAKSSPAGNQYLMTYSYLAIPKDHKILISAFLRSDTDNECRFQLIQQNPWASLNVVTISGINSTRKMHSTIVSVSDGTASNFNFNVDNKQSLEISNVNLVDLTQMLGSTIADYIYNLEQATAGAGVAYFRALFPDDYYSYNAGELLSVKASAHIMRNASNAIIGNYALDSNLELRGIPQIDANGKLTYDGDTYSSNGNVVRKYGIVDLGALDWIYDASSHLFVNDTTPLKYVSGNETPNMLACGYVTTTPNQAYGNIIDKAISSGAGNSSIWIYNSLYSDATTFKTAMNGVFLIYEKASSTTETAQPFTNPQNVDANGSEEYTDARAVKIPVGHETAHANICEIGGWNACDVKRTGKNLLIPFVERTITENGITFVVNSDGTIHATGRSTGRSNLFHGGDMLAQNLRAGNYVISDGVERSAHYMLEIAIWQNGNLNYYSTSGIDHFTISDGDSVQSIYISIFDGAGDVDLIFQPQIELGSEATDFEAYEGITKNISFNQTVYKARLNIKTGRMEILGAVADIGAMDWSKQGDYFQNSSSQFASQGWERNKITLMAECYHPIAWSTIDGGNAHDGDIAQLVYSGNGIIRIYNSAYETAGEFKNAMDGMHFLYLLPEPIIIQLTAQEIMALIGENHIFTNTGAIESCVYMKDGAEIEASGEIITFIADVGDIISNAFKNRLIIGNYDDVKLEKGINSITFNPIEEGSEIDEMAISKYSRWL